MRKIKTAVFASGRGSNLKALIEASKQPATSYEIVLVISDHRDAPALDQAAASGILAVYIPHTERRQFAKYAAEILAESQAELIALAGFMKILDGEFVTRWDHRIINIHPSLLPDFPGLHSHRRALEAKKSHTGVTVHYVVPEVDAGPIIGQVVVPVHEWDNEETLASRVLQVEHKFYPICLEHVARQIQGEVET